MQQGAQLCFNGNFLVDRSEYPPLASRVLTSSGVAALPRRRDAYAQDGAQGHLSSEGLGGDPKHRGAIRPKPQCKLSRMSQLLTIYTNPRLQAISYAIMLARLAYDGKLAANLIREDNRSGPGKYDRGIPVEVWSMCARRADRERRNAPQFRVQVEEITSQERNGKCLPAAAEVPTAPD